MANDREDKLLTLTPIGHVESHIEPGEQATWEEIDSSIIIDDSWVEGLDGLGDFSHVIIVFWLDKPRDGEIPLRVHPEADEDMPLVGLFATRGPRRPNPIGVTAVELLAVEGNTLRVRGLDAYDGTPVLDIKPYLIRGDLKPGASAPEWLHRLWGKQDSGE